KRKSIEARNQANDIISHIPPGQPILVGHHSEGRHRRDLRRFDNNMRRSVENSEKMADHLHKADYWEDKGKEINLSMPESIEYFEKELEEYKEVHIYYKENPDKRPHSYALTYARKKVKETEHKLGTAKLLWS